VSRHYSDDELTLYYYGEGRHRARIEAHLPTCAACAALYREIAGTLAIVVAEPVPERGEQYGLEVWQRIRHRLPEQETGFSRFAGFAGFSRLGEWLTVERLGLAGAAAALAIVAFVAGRSWRPPSESAPTVATTSVNPATPTSRGNAANPTNTEKPNNRILLTSVADHLERSERMLTDVMNGAAGDISTEQRWAEDLLTTSRLYRQDAMDAGEQSVASVLDELERNLLEIVHSPAKISAADLEQLRRRIDAAALLFKVRVLGDELRRREEAPADSSTPRTTSPSLSKVG
jgi:hypothetical protein